MKRILQLLFVALIFTSIAANLNAKCVSYASRGAGWSFSNKDCKYTFTANKLTDSSCFYFAWYQGKKLLGTGSTYTTTFSTTDSAEYTLRIINICDTTCADTFIDKKVVYHCAPKCIWSSKKPGYSYSNKDCVYTFEANNLHDSCMVYKWYKGKDLLGTGRVLTQTFSTNGYSEICLKVIDTCRDCDTSICKTIQYNCGSKCNWKDRNAGWGHVRKDCVYNLEATNLKDSCVTYTWLEAGKVLGTGRLLTYKFVNSKAVICLKIKDTCKGCDTTICQIIYDSCTTASKCNWQDRKAGFSYVNKGCVYTFEATNLHDSCVVYKWYKGKDLLGTGRILTQTFTTNGYSEICLKLIDTCHSCDTTICKTVQYNCGSKCNWKDRNAGWGHVRKDCLYSLEANNLKDSCVTYTWMSAGKVLGTGRLLTYKFVNSKAEICLKIKDICKGCDTTICKLLYDSCTTTIEIMNDLNSSINIYPNPSNAGFELVLPHGVFTSAKLFDLIGNEITCPQQELDNSISFDTKNIANGIYMIRVKIGNTSSAHKVVVRH